MHDLRAGDVGVSRCFSHGHMATLTGTAISILRMLLYLQQPSTISHSEPQSLLVFMIWFWPTILSCQRSEQLTPGTLVASHPASSWIKMVLPPSWDRHFKMSRVARMFTNPWTWNHPLQALFIRPKISQLHPVATILRSGEPQGSPYWMAPIGRTKPCHRRLTMKIFSRPTEPYI